MTLDLDPEHQPFIDEIRSFLRDSLPPRLAAKVRAGGRVTLEEHVEWQEVLAARGWVAPHWPVEFGGQGWSPLKCHLFELECARASAPPQLPFGTRMIGPALIRVGTNAQRAYWLPRILEGSDWWAVGFSEHDSGSDLASLTTTATREDDDSYVVRGRKLWVSMGHMANMCCVLARVMPPAGARVQRLATRHARDGFALLMIEMDAPGVEVRPIRLYDGSSELCEIAFDDVRVRIDQRIGAEEDAWTCAKQMLAAHRSEIASAGTILAALQSLQQRAAHTQRGGRPVLQDPIFAARFGELEIEVENFRITSLRLLQTAERGHGSGVEGAMLKVLGSELLQRVHTLSRETAGPHAQVFLDRAVDGAAGAHGDPVRESAMLSAQYLNSRKLSLQGGSNETQRNLLARGLLRF